MPWSTLRFDDGTLVQQVWPIDMLRHAPVDILGPKPMATPTTCPQCGARVDVQNVEKLDPNDPQRRRRLVRVALCGFCDYMQEILK